MRFMKMQGAGNDFIILDDWDLSIPEADFPSLAAEMCRRRLSLGADGLMVVLPPQEGGDLAMRFYNSDGSGYNSAAGRQYRIAKEITNVHFKMFIWNPAREIV